jgi:hypothetical protein
MPSCAANLWQARQRAASLVGWMLWLVTFVFAVTAGLGFASTNLSDVTLARASRVTPAVTMAQTALSDATIARDRECKGGVGKFCRDREALVAERRQILDAAQTAVGLHADPQTDAAIRLAAWTSRGLLRPMGRLRDASVDVAGVAAADRRLADDGGAQRRSIDELAPFTGAISCLEGDVAPVASFLTRVEFFLAVRSQDAGPNWRSTMSDLEQIIRERAYQLWVEDGCGHGKAECIG